MAKADTLYVGNGVVKHPRDDSRRVGIVQKQRIRAQLFHIVTEPQHEWGVAQGREGAARPGGATHHLVDAVGPRDTHGLVPNVDAVELDGGNDVVGAVQGLPAVGSRFYLGGRTQFRDHLAGDIRHNVEISALMSMRVRVPSARAGRVMTSWTNRLPNPLLPAPMTAIFGPPPVLPLRLSACSCTNCAMLIPLY